MSAWGACMHAFMAVCMVVLARLSPVMAMKEDLLSVATALASRVFPLPGGPNSSTPLGGCRMPMKRSGTEAGQHCDFLQEHLDLVQAGHLVPCHVACRSVHAWRA